MVLGFRVWDFGWKVFFVAKDSETYRLRFMPCNSKEKECKVDSELQGL